MSNQTTASVSVKEVVKKQKEMQVAIRAKNSLLIRQTKRIQLLEEKIIELRKKYFQLKYSDVIMHLKSIV